MNILILIVLLVGAIVGFVQGAFKQIAKFIGFFAGIIIASRYSEQVGDFLSTTTGASASIGKTFAFVLIILIVPIALGWIASLLTKLFSDIHLGFLNRLAGAGIGAISYIFLLSFAFNLMDFAQSGGGFNQENLEEREESFYLVKHISQPFIPDFLIVDDATEVAELDSDEEPRCGLKPAVDKAVDEAVDKMNPFN